MLVLPHPRRRHPKAFPPNVLCEFSSSRTAESSPIARRGLSFSCVWLSSTRTTLASLCSSPSLRRPALASGRTWSDPITTTTANHNTVAASPDPAPPPPPPPSGGSNSAPDGTPDARPREAYSAPTPDLARLHSLRVPLSGSLEGVRGSLRGAISAAATEGLWRSSQGLGLSGFVHPAGPPPTRPWERSRPVHFTPHFESRAQKRASGSGASHGPRPTQKALAMKRNSQANRRRRREQSASQRPTDAQRYRAARPERESSARELGAVATGSDQLTLTATLGLVYLAPSPTRPSFPRSPRPSPSPPPPSA